MQNEIISLLKKYRTEGGQPVNLFSLTNNVRPSYPIIGEYLDESDGWRIFHWTKTGSSSGVSENRLVEIPEWEDWKIDTRVRVKISQGHDSGKIKERFENCHFAGAYKGIPYVFAHGLSSWTISHEGPKWAIENFENWCNNRYMVIPVPFITSDIQYQSMQIAE